MTDQPRQPPYASETDALALPAGHSWTPQEQWAWARILRGETADMSNFDPKLDRTKDFAAWLEGADDGAGWKASAETDGKLDPWPDHRHLSATFLRVVLFQKPHSEARARPWVRIRAAQFTEPLVWASETFNGELWLDCSRFAGDLLWRGLRVGGLLSMDGSRIETELGADGLIVEGDLLCNDGFIAKSALRLRGARISGSAEFIGATVEGEIAADGLALGGALFCRDGFTAKGELRLPSARIGMNAEFDGATLEGDLVGDSMAVSGALFCRKGFTAKGDMRLLGAHVGANAEFTEATLEGSLIGDNLSVEGGLYLREMKRLGTCELMGIRVRGDVQLRDSTIAGVVNLTGATIDGELHLATDAQTSPSWTGSARLVLRNATIGALAGGVESFPKAQRNAAPPMELAGLSYTRLGGLGAGNEKAGSLAEATPKQLVAWLEAGHNSRNFTPGPYRQLASALIAAGHAGKANQILHAMRKHERRCETNPWRRLGLFFSGRAIGFGYRNDYAVYWFAVLVFVFAAIGLNWNAMTALDANDVRPFEFTSTGWNEFGRWIGFSFGNSVPLIQLDKAHETFLAVEFVPGAATAEEPERYVHQLPAVIAWVFYAQKVFGFAILSFLAAGLTGTATRQRE